MHQKFTQEFKVSATIYNGFIRILHLGLSVRPPAAELWRQTQLHSEGGGRQHQPEPHLPPPRALQGRHHRARERGGRRRAPAVRLTGVLRWAARGRWDRDSGEGGVREGSRRCKQHCEVRRTSKETYCTILCSCGLLGFISCFFNLLTCFFMFWTKYLSS